MPNIWFNKYPYTDFHELDLSFLLDTTDALKQAVSSLTERVTSLESGLSALADRVSTAEGQITTLNTNVGGLQTRMTTAEGKITSLENADIMDAVMLKEVTGVTPSASNVVIGFTKDTYVDGAKTAGTDSATIPSANLLTAGVMTPTDKAKLVPISVSGDDVTFAGKVILSESATSNNQAVTKQYVDDLAISGSASVTRHITVGGSWSSSYGTFEDATQIPYGLQYGAMRFLSVFVVLNVTTAIPNDTLMCSLTPTQTGYDSERGLNVPLIVTPADDGTTYPTNVFLSISGGGAVQIKNYGDTIPIGQYIIMGAMCWIVH